MKNRMLDKSRIQSPVSPEGWDDLNLEQPSRTCDMGAFLLHARTFFDFGGPGGKGS
jgi:hypothetical protein